MERQHHADGGGEKAAPPQEENERHPAPGRRSEKQRGCVPSSVGFDHMTEHHLRRQALRLDGDTSFLDDQLHVAKIRKSQPCAEIVPPMPNALEQWTP